MKKIKSENSAKVKVSIVGDQLVVYILQRPKRLATIQALFTCSRKALSDMATDPHQKRLPNQEELENPD